MWHAAGEKWEGVRARFSTARPARDAAPPLVRDDILHLRRKTAEERTRVIVEARSDPARGHRHRPRHGAADETSAASTTAASRWCSPP
ncbi:MAG: hypothetical protein R3F14_44145 [Polyangiaceae bacterium]